MPTLTELPPETGTEELTRPAGNVAAAWRAYHTPGANSTGPSAESDHEFIERHLPLVKTVVGRMRIHLPPHLDADDLYSVGLGGLMTAVRKYNPTMGNTFHGYAMLCIRGAVLDELRRMDWMPRTMRYKAKQVRDNIAQLESRHGRAVTEQEAADALGLSLDDYLVLLDEVRPITFVPIDGDADDGEEGGYLHETIADQNQPMPGDALERRELLETVTAHIRRLPEMQRKVLALYYHEGLRLSEIAAVFDVTESRISQIHTQAILGLRAFVRRSADR